MNISRKFLKFLKSFYFNRRQIWLRKNYEQFPKNSYILDIGCARGNFVFLDPARIIGYDRNFLSLKIGKKHNLLNLVCGDGFKLPFKDESFSNIHCADLIEHFDANKLVILLREVYRVLKKGGLLLIATAMPGEEFWGEHSHVRPYPPQSIIAFFQENEDRYNPTLDSVGLASVVKLYWRYRPLVRQPQHLYTDERRTKPGNLIRLSSLLFYLGNILARFNIVCFWKPAGYSLVLQKKLLIHG